MPVEDWIDAHAKGSTEKQKRFYSTMSAIVDRLEQRDGKPDGELLFDQGDGLFIAECNLGGGSRWTLSYYITEDARIFLLSAIETLDGLAPAEVINRAREAMVRCIRHGDDLDRA